MENQEQKGLFISIDGADGSGKSTQIQILAERFRSLGYEVEIIKFPQYGKKSAGMVEEYLNGKYGDADNVGPYASSIFYATDRYDAKDQIKTWLTQGKIVLSDRYVSANMGHQGGKIDDEEKRKQFFEWLYNLEYEVFQVPKPDINIILHVSSNISKKLLDELEKKKYLENSKQDIHEASSNHLKNANRVYLELNKLFDDFQLIDCSPDNLFLNKEVINQNIWKIISPFLKNKGDYSPDFIKSKGFLYGGELMFHHRKELHDNYTDDFYNILKVEKIFDNAKLPTRSYEHDAGLDLSSVESKTIYPGERAIVRTGLKIAIPEGHVGLVWDKSGLAKTGLNTMGGVIDAGFRGELTINIANVSNNIYNIEIGQKIAQLLIQKIENPLILETKLDDKTERGENGYGSSGLY
ncbi:MAG: dUTP diphosphatase [Patescibacteria group bacterium]|nr:dUTP diphosphatase [Patescibacteria group bacterium]